MNNLIVRYLNFIKKFIPSRPETSSIGLDISQDECRLVEVRKEEKSFKVIRAVCEGGPEVKPAETIKNLLSENDLSNTSIQTSVSGKGTLIRYIEMPRMSQDELKNSFSLEADKYFPFASDQIYTDCFILDPQGKTKQMDVMAAASTKDLVDNSIAQLAEAGVQPDSITIKSVAISNVVNELGTGEEEGDEEKVFAVVDIGETISSVTIVSGTLPRFSRDIFMGGKDLTKRIGNSLGIEVDEAAKLRENPGDKQDEVKSACESIIQSMAQEIRLSFDYFSTEKNKEVIEVLITGELAGMPGIQELFKENLEVEVDMWDPFALCELSESVNRDELKAQAHKYSVALGLALLHHD